MKFFKIFKIRTYLKRFYKRCKLCNGMRHPPLIPPPKAGGAVGTIRFFANAQNDRKTLRMAAEQTDAETCHADACGSI